MINALLTDICCYFSGQGIGAVSFVGLQGHYCTDSLEKFGFRLRKEENVFMVRDNSPDIQKDFILDARNWLITLGDCDVETLL